VTTTSTSTSAAAAASAIVAAAVAVAPLLLLLLFSAIVNLIMVMQRIRFALVDCGIRQLLKLMFYVDITYTYVFIFLTDSHNSR